MFFSLCVTAGDVLGSRDRVEMFMELSSLCRAITQAIAITTNNNQDTTIQIRRLF
jgi:hypothetical protein